MTRTLDQAVGGNAPAGQVRLTYSSTTSLLLKPFNGNLLWINGANRTISSAGVSLVNTGLTAATLYYVYAFMSGSTLTLEAVTTGHATDPNYGHEIKSGDGTRTLVGMVYTASGSPGTFADSVTQRFTATWFNRRGVQLSATASNLQFGGTTPAFNSATLVQFLAWADEPIQGGLEGTARSDTANAIVTTQYGIDGAGVGQPQAPNVPAAGQQVPVGIPFSTTLSEGLHSATGAISTTSGTGTWTMTNTVTTRQ